MIKNIVSDGPSGEESDLHMTYAFELNFPKLEEGSPEAEKMLQTFKGVSYHFALVDWTGLIVLADFKNGG
jgi:hypothetical protein